jgi:uncharacterized protein YceK
MKEIMLIMVLLSGCATLKDRYNSGDTERSSLVWNRGGNWSKNEKTFDALEWLA